MEACSVKSWTVLRISYVSLSYSHHYHLQSINLFNPSQVSFGVAPATLAYTLGLRLPLDILSLLFFACCGLARLARFNATVALMPKGGSGSVKYFTGIPIPSSLGLTAFMAACVKFGKFAGAQGWVTSVVEGAKGVASHGVRAVDWAAVRRQGDLPGGTVLLFGEHGGLGEVHLLSVVFLLWGAAMVSKTLKVSQSRLFRDGITRLTIDGNLGSQAVNIAKICPHSTV